MQCTLGIDLGIANSVMACLYRGEPLVIANGDNRELTPSMVARGRRGELLVGTAARARPKDSIYSVRRFMGRQFGDADVQEALSRMQLSYRVTEGADGDVRVWLGEREYTPIEISSMILRRLKEDAEKRVGERFTRAVIAVPAYFGERQVAATREAGHMAGFQVLQIINEPSAAVLAFGLDRDPAEYGKTILVYDLDSGTFDISILLVVRGSITVIGIAGDIHRDESDLDVPVVKWLLELARQRYQVDLSADRRAIQILRQAAERVRITLSTHPLAEVFLPDLGLGQQAIDLEAELYRSDFEALIRPRIEHSTEMTQKAIRDAHLTPDDIDEILLVGGSTTIPLVRKMLGTIFGAHKVRQHVSPMSCVAIGAAMQSAITVDVECLGCHKRVSASLDDCDRCGASMEPPPRVACLICGLAVDASATECWKCGNRMVRPMANDAVQLGIDALVDPPVSPELPNQISSPQSPLPHDTTDGGKVNSPLVFISANHADYEYAMKIYEHLCARGIRAFFSEESLPQTGRSNFRHEIDSALDEAHHLIVVTSSPENAASRWVAFEWGAFAGEQRAERKLGNLLTVIVGSIDHGKLPLALRNNQIIPIDNLDLVLRYVQR